VVHENSLFILGGYGGNGRLDDLWEYRFQEEQWHKLNARGQIPAGRENNGAVIYKGAMYIFGGYSGVFWLNDFYKLDLCKSYIEALWTGLLSWSEMDTRQVRGLDMSVRSGKTLLSSLEGMTGPPGLTTCMSSTSLKLFGLNLTLLESFLQKEAALLGQLINIHFLSLEDMMAFIE
jgi:hypothetical protein